MSEFFYVRAKVFISVDRLLTMQNEQTSRPSVDLSPTAALLSSGSPKGMYTYFLLALCKNYFEAINVNNEEFSDERCVRCTAALIAFCPDKNTRETLWNKFVDLREGHGETKQRFVPFQASVFVVGDLITFLSDVLELQSKSTGGLL